MGLLYKEIDRHEVVNILRQKGYGEHGSRRFAMAFNRPTGKRWQSGSEEREFAFGISHEQLEQILKHSDSPEEAARRVEACGLGQEPLVGESAAAGSLPQSNGLSMELAEKLIENRVGAEVAKATAPLHRELANLAQQLTNVLAMVTPVKKPMGRPKGSKNKPKEPPQSAPATAQSA